ncbi:MAG: ribose-5-phosphate isomerase RpiA [Bacteroidota bacterium]
MKAKQAAGEKAVEWVQSGMKVGLGTGSTAYFAIKKLGEKVRQGLSVVCVPTSVQSQQLALEYQIPLVPLASVTSLDITIDGADEFTPELDLIKGGGGALFREKLVASISRTLLIIADPSKAVKKLGAFPLPIEVVPFGHELVMRRLEAKGIQAQIRQQDGTPFLTDNGNLIVDCQMGVIDDPEALHEWLIHQIGVVETGLFLGMADRVIVGEEDGTCKIWEKQV